MVFPSLRRAISKWVSVEQGEYLNYSDLSPTKFPLNILYVETPLKRNPGKTKICLSWKTFVQAHRYGVLRIQTSINCVKWNLLVIKKMQSLVVLL